jgi:hypothetical protein
MHRNCPTAMQSSKNFAGKTLLELLLYAREEKAEVSGVAVARCITTENRGASMPDAELYRDREFVK